MKGGLTDHGMAPMERPTIAEDTNCDARARPGSARTILRSNLRAIVVMMAAVTLQVMGAVVLKTIADHWSDFAIWMLAVAVVVVICINIVRLGVWGYAHRRFSLSSTFPLSSLFYPAMLAVAAAYGDTIGVRQIVGALLITSGSLWLSTRVVS